MFFRPCCFWGDVQPVIPRLCTRESAFSYAWGRVSPPGELTAGSGVCHEPTLCAHWNSPVFLPGCVWSADHLPSRGSRFRGFFFGCRRHFLPPKTVQGFCTIVIPPSVFEPPVDFEHMNYSSIEICPRSDNSLVIFYICWTFRLSPLRGFFLWGLSPQFFTVQLLFSSPALPRIALPALAIFFSFLLGSFVSRHTSS